MNEQSFDNFEQAIEKIPTPEEVKSIFEQLIEGKEGENGYETERSFEDEQGLYLWTIKVKLDEAEDEYVEYEYTRKGRYEKTEEHGSVQAGDSAIHMTNYEKIEGTEDYMPTGGRSVAKHIDGEWILSL
jgi:hypothetical protein